MPWFVLLQEWRSAAGALLTSDAGSSGELQAAMSPRSEVDLGLSTIDLPKSSCAATENG